MIWSVFYLTNLVRETTYKAPKLLVVNQGGLNQWFSMSGCWRHNLVNHYYYNGTITRVATHLLRTTGLNVLVNDLNKKVAATKPFWLISNLHLLCQLARSNCLTTKLVSRFF